MHLKSCFGLTFRVLISLLSGAFYLALRFCPILPQARPAGIPPTLSSEAFTRCVISASYVNAPPLYLSCLVSELLAGFLIHIVNFFEPVCDDSLEILFDLLMNYLDYV